MKPLSALSAEEALGLEGLLFDLDDTFFHGGRLDELAFASLFRLRASGLRLHAVTGRPASWAELAVRWWPLDGAVGENGAQGFYRDGARVRCRDTVTAAERASRSTALVALVSEARRALPELVPADDTSGRISDYAFDIGEHERAPEELIARAVELANDHGARTTRSSVHLHFTFDRIDKASGTVSFLSHFGVEPTRALHRYAFVGDSPNDASCFAAFHTTVGVANLRGDFSLLPTYVTGARESAGFVELAERLLRLRAG
ncbi:MAG TPA: hypothetical protein VLC09_12540 [Polyangiaceae bacterium]|nr:hypothetical protein [Polyangiaceae bacterium]